MERYLHDYAYLHRSFEHVCMLLERYPERVLERATAHAADQAGELVIRLSVELGGFVLERDARIEVEEFDRQANVARLSFRWEAISNRSLFPMMHADLEVYRLTGAPRPLTQIAFVGHYRPPLAVLGAAADAFVGRRIAEAVVYHFVKGVRANIEHELSPLGIGKHLSEDGGAVAS